MLSKRLRIGRTPIREALHRLARERLVMILPRRGIVVSEINLKSHLRLLETRREVERLVTRLAARRATDEERAHFRNLAERFVRCAERADETGFMRADREFNELILAASKNEFAAGSMRLMQSLSRRFWFHHYKEAADMPETAKLHADQARAIAAADETGAAKATDRLIALKETFARATVSPEL
jgi:DNA-binding GntR family transcriptional regulator